MAEVKKVNVLSVGKISALLGAFTGFVLGVVSDIIILWASKNSTLQSIGYSAPTTSNLIISPFYLLLVMCIFSGIAGLLFALVYNLIAKYSGGLKIELK